MPEGPEIRIAADCVAGAIAGQRLNKVEFTPPGLRKFERRLTGTTQTFAKRSYRTHGITNPTTRVRELPLRAGGSIFARHVRYRAAPVL